MGGQADRMGMFIRVLAATVVLLLGVQVIVALRAGPSSGSADPAPPPRAASPAPAVSPVAGGVPAAADLDVGAPMELNWILCRMAKTPALAPRGEQKQKLLALLEKARDYTEEMNPLWVESQSLVRESLTAAQRAFIVQRLEQMRRQNQRIGGGPMNDALLGLIQRKLGRDFMADDVHTLLRLAKELPPASNAGGVDALNPEDFAWGVTVLEEGPGLGISRDQAARIAPYVKLQTDLFQSHEREKVALVALLTPEQKAFVRDTRQHGYPPDNPPFATVAELIAVLQGQ